MKIDKKRLAELIVSGMVKVRKAKMNPGDFAKAVIDKDVDTVKTIPGIEIDEVFALAMGLKIRKNRFALYSKMWSFAAGVLTSAAIASLGAYVANL